MEERKKRIREGHIVCCGTRSDYKSGSFIFKWLVEPNDYKRFKVQRPLIHYMNPKNTVM